MYYSQLSHPLTSVVFSHLPMSVVVFTGLSRHTVFKFACDQQACGGDIKT
jgi:hypothetical protein